MASPNSSPPNRVVVVGGGITGLMTALRLDQAAQRDGKLSVVLLERSDRLGGKISTEHVDGFLVEGGPDTFLARKPEAIALCRELGLDDQLIPTRPDKRRSFVSRAGKLHQLPEGMSGLAPTKLGPLFKSRVLSLRGKLRAACEPFIRRATDETDETVAAFMRRRLGSETYDRLVEPLLCGIHAGDGDKLSLEATMPILKRIEEEHGSILRGLRLREHAVDPTLEKFPTPFVSLAGGVQQMVDAIVAHIDSVAIRTATEVVNMRRTGSTYVLELDDGSEIEAPVVVLATPAFAAARLLDSINPSLAAVLNEIQFVSNAAVTMAFRAADIPDPLDGYGYVVPRREGRDALACSWATSKLPNRAPDGYALVRVFLGRAGREIHATTDDTSLMGMARNELREVLGVEAEPTLSRIFRYPQGMPQYTMGHTTRLDSIDRLLNATPGIFVAGNSYRGVGISDCIRSGQKVAFRSLRHLQEIFSP